MLCIVCQCETSNPKFCTRSCAARFNNTAFPKKKKQPHQCKKCLVPLELPRIVCNECLTTGTKKTRDGVRVPYAFVTKGDILTDDTQRFRRIRESARQVALEHGKLKACQECGYSLHVEACHVTPIKDFPDDTLLSDLNSPSNLVGLCRNHHWEFDHGHLTLKASALSD